MWRIETSTLNDKPRLKCPHKEMDSYKVSCSACHMDRSITSSKWTDKETNIDISEK